MEKILMIRKRIQQLECVETAIAENWKNADYYEKALKLMENLVKSAKFWNEKGDK